MKIAIIFPNNLFKAPYLNYYLQILDDHNIEYDIYNWNRAGISEPNCISYNSKEESRNLFRMILEFYRYKKFITNKVSPKEYEKVIVFTGQISILLSRFLITNFKTKYLIDIRDYSKVIPLLKSKFNKVLKNAKLICISSNGFRSWLPKDIPLTMSHNLNLSLLKENHHKDLFFQNVKINIDTIGAIRDLNSNTRVIDVLKNHPEFEMKFIGDGLAIPFLKKQATSENITNIDFHGYYQKKEEFSLLKKTDFINIMVDENILSTTLTSNRLYLCALLKIPAIVNHNTEQSRIIEKYNFGLVVDNYNTLPEMLLNYKTNFNKNTFITNCNRFLDDVKSDQNIFKSKVEAFLKK